MESCSLQLMQSTCRDQGLCVWSSLPQDECRLHWKLSGSWVSLQQCHRSKEQDLQHWVELPTPYLCLPLWFCWIVWKVLLEPWAASCEILQPLLLQVLQQSQMKDSGLILDQSESAMIPISMWFDATPVSPSCNAIATTSLLVWSSTPSNPKLRSWNILSQISQVSFCVCLSVCLSAWGIKRMET